MSTLPDTQLLESSGFRLLRGDRYLDARRSAADEIMRRNVAGETRDTWDNTFYFRHRIGADLGEALMATGRLPDLCEGVPVASWVLARLRRIMPGYVPENSSIVSDGGHSYDFYVLRGETPAAWLQLQGNMGGVALLGDVGEEAMAEWLPVLFLGLLLDQPGEVAACTVEVVDPDWAFEPDSYEPVPDESSRNRFGHDGMQYLGAGNITEID